MTTLHLHHLSDSRSFRIIWLLEELGTPYHLTHHTRHNGLAPVSLKSIHPMGKAPILQDGDKTLIESAHIIEYLIDHYDGNADNLIINKTLRPDYGTEAYQDYRYWLHFAEGSLMPLLVLRLAFSMSVEKSPLGIKQIAGLLKNEVEKGYINPTLQAELDMLELHLANHQWLAGDQFTGADIQLEFGLTGMLKSNAKSFNNYPHIKSWLQKCHDRPAYEAALKKAAD